jgi:potassium efflux system protein
VPLALGALALLGYLYTAGTLLGVLLRTTWLAVGLIVLAALAVRWLLVARRRLAYEAAIEVRQAEEAARREDDSPEAGQEGSTIEIEEPEVDLVALGDTSRKLLNSAILFSGFFGLWAIWADVFPALRFLDDITLWYHTVTLDGADTRLPVTLGDLVLSLIYLIVVVVLAKQLPAVLEIILLRQSDMTAGSRYTVTTLTSYVIVALGILLAFQTIGLDWSKLQWLVAALGVGIGFGLQEIVANFISGIIILFERPIRVGDVVTVGDTDGFVTRIQIRATTIQNWDGMELLVPNKEFITGRLLNWSLSDPTTRIIITVGVAYGSDVRMAMRLLEEAAMANGNVLADPPPTVIFQGFGDSALSIVLRCHVGTIDDRPFTVSALNEAINDKFSEAGIAIAFPQRDLHLVTSTPLRVSIEDARKGTP